MWRFPLFALSIRSTGCLYHRRFNYVQCGVQGLYVNLYYGTRAQISDSQCLRLELWVLLCNYTSKCCWIIVLFLCISSQSPPGTHCGAWRQRLRRPAGNSSSVRRRSVNGGWGIFFRLVLRTPLNLSLHGAEAQRCRGTTSRERIFVLRVRGNRARSCTAASLARSNWFRTSARISVSRISAHSPGCSSPNCTSGKTLESFTTNVVSRHFRYGVGVARTLRINSMANY